MKSIEDFLIANNISFEKYSHPAVFTCAQSESLNINLPGAATKNLFIHAKKEKSPIIVVVGHGKKVDMRKLGSLIKEKDLCFGSPEMLKKYLGVTPGSVTALALINDSKHLVRVIVDKEIWDAEFIQWHPLINTETFVISHEGAELFFKATGHKVEIMEIPGKG